MKNKTIASLFFCTAFLTSSQLVSAGALFNKTLATIHSGDSRPCTMIKVKNDLSWYALPKSNSNHDTAVALLLTSMTSGRAINIVTLSSQVAECDNFTEIKNIQLVNN